MSYKAILADHLVDHQPEKARELQKEGQFQNYLNQKTQEAREVASEVLKNLGNGPAEKVIAREIALAHVLEPESEQEGELEILERASRVYQRAKRSRSKGPAKTT